MRLATTVGFALTFAVVCFGQTGQGEINGKVFDPAGAVVPNATVLLINVRTLATERSQTDKNGQFHFSEIAPEHFEVKLRINASTPIRKGSL